MFKDIKTKEKEAFDVLKQEFGYKNRNQTPKIEKVIIATGVGSITEKSKLEIIPDRIAKITGQYPAKTFAKKSIAQFKTREGQLSGYRVTLRGETARTFLDKLIHVALPRTRDFRGLNPKCVDDMGNYTIGIKEHTIFPETSDEELRNVFGMQISINTTSSNKNETLALLRHLGLPIKQEG